MTGKLLDLPIDDPRRRSLRSSVVTLVLFVVAAVAAYFALPVNEFGVVTVLDALVLTVSAFGLLLFLYLRSLRKITKSEAPLVRAITGLVVFFVLFILLFAYVFLLLEASRPGEVPGLVTHLDGLYFTVTMTATVGFGDIAPAGQAARAVATAQMVFNLVFLGAVLRISVKLGREAAEARLAKHRDSRDGGRMLSD